MCCFSCAFPTDISGVVSERVVFFSKVLGLCKSSGVNVNLWFAKPMVCNPAAFTKTTGITQTATNTRGSNAGFADATKVAKSMGIQGTNHGFPKNRVKNTRNRPQVHHIPASGVFC